MINPTDQILSNKNHHHFIEKNIKQTKKNHYQIDQYENNHILPFSHKKLTHKKSNHHLQNINNELYQSNLSEKLCHFQSINKKSQQNQYSNNSDEVSQQESILDTRQIQDKKNNLSKKDFKKNELFEIPGQQKMQVQVHLAIAKKKYTLKISNLIQLEDLSETVERFLVENQISNPSKKSHLKTKKAIIQMVAAKLRESPSADVKPSDKQNKISQANQQKKSSHGLKTSSNQPFKQNQDQQVNKVKKIFIDKKAIKNAVNNKVQNDSNLSYEHQQEGACSPNFKSSQNTENCFLIDNVSCFSPKPKHKQNKYQKLISNYYNDHVKQKASNQILVTKNTLQQNSLPNKFSEDSKQLQKKLQQNLNLKDHFHPFHTQQQCNQSTPKSVYEKWKQKEKSKDQNRSTDNSVSNVLKVKKIITNQSRPALKNRSSIKQQEKSCEKKSNPQFNENKWIKKVTQEFINRNLTKSPFQIENQNLIKQKKKDWITDKQNQNYFASENNNMNSSFSTSKHNKSAYEQRKTPPNMNKTQFYNLKDHQIENQLDFVNKSQNHKQNRHNVFSPLNKNRSNHKANGFEPQKNSKVYTIYDEQFPEYNERTFEMSPDHFYKQGLVFQAKKKQQLDLKFKSLYPFTTRGQQIDSHSAKIEKNLAKKSQKKYFQTKLSKRLLQATINEKQKSALHERLYNDDKLKKKKQIQVQYAKNYIEIPKNSTHHAKLNLMEQNLSHIKGLSQQKKTKLIEKNFLIKERIRLKDKTVDQELEQMIKEGKAHSVYQIASIKKSPFRKTQAY